MTFTPFPSEAYFPRDFCFTSPPDLEAYDFHAKQLPPYFPLCQRAFDFPYEASSIDFYK